MSRLPKDFTQGDISFWNEIVQSSKVRKREHWHIEWADKMFELGEKNGM